MLRVRIKIAEGAERSKCASCQYSHVITTTGQNQFVKCQWSQAHIKEPVEKCNRYLEEGSMSLFEMQQVAWVLEVKKGDVVGFIKPEEILRRSQPR